MQLADAASLPSCLYFNWVASNWVWYFLADRMPVILGSKDSVNAWLNDASVKLEEITAPYEGADLVSPCYA